MKRIPPPVDDPLRPRAPDDLKRGALVAVLGMLGLIAALSLGLRWHMNQPQGVQAELWSRLPTLAGAAPPPEPPPAPVPPQPQEVAPQVQPPVEHAPPPVRPDIQVRQDKEKEVRREEEKPKPKAAPVEKPKPVPKPAPKPEHVAKVPSAQALSKAQADARQAALARMMSELGGGTTADGGRSNQTAGVSLGYAGRVIAAVRPNIVFIDQPPSDQIMAAVVVTTDALGNITSIKLKKSSGFAPWDDAVLRALNKTRVMPRDINGSVPTPMLLKFRPSDMGSAP